MTSKEALVDIQNILREELIFESDVKELIEPIEKDLEVLEILKKHLKLHNSCYIAINNGINNEDTEIQKENKIIKEWLENENC